MEYVLVSGPIWFFGGLGVLPRTLLYCTENVQVFMGVSGGGGRGLCIPLKSQKYSISLQCWSSEESQSCQLSIQCWAIISLPANSMAFPWWPDVVTLTVSPIKKSKSWTPLPKHCAPTSIET